MTETPIPQIKIPKMSSDRFKDRTFRLLWIQGINTTPGNNFYKVLFQDIDSGIYLTEEIFPEFLRYYSIGLHYRDSLLVDNITPLGHGYGVCVNSTDNNRIVKVADVLTDAEYNLGQWFRTAGGYFDFSKYNKQQYCVVFEEMDLTIIIPCAVVGAHFYFTSSSMRRQLFKMRLDGLYEEIKFDRAKRQASILMKHGASKNDAPFIVRFAEDKFARSRWLSVYKSMLEMKKQMDLTGSMANIVPLQIDFPVNQRIEIGVRGLMLHQKPKDKLLVFDILSDDSAFDFDKIEMLMRDKKKSPDKNKVFKVKQTGTKNQLKNAKPTSRLREVAIALSSINSVANSRIGNIRVIESSVPEKQQTLKEVGIPIVKVTEPSVGISVIEGGSDGNAETRAAAIESAPKNAAVKEADKSQASDQSSKEAKDDFTLIDFFIMVHSLYLFEGVLNINFYPDDFVPLKDTRKPRSILALKESVNKRFDERRAFSVISFQYSDRNVCLVEIDHTGLSTGPGTYILISEKESSCKYAKMVVKRFVEGVLHEETISDLQKVGVTFGTKIHPSSKEEDFYKRWCEELLKRI